MPTYRLSVYDPSDHYSEDGKWTPQRTGLSKWGLREAIRWARSCGYDVDVSILVERED